VKIEKREIKLYPEVLKTFRETSGYTIAEIAKKLKTSENKIISVEEGKSLFTLNQIKKLAEIYKRPLAAFFSDSIPELPELVDYRINREKRLTPDVYLAKRRAKYLSEKIKEISGKKNQIPSFSKGLTAEELAKEFKIKLKIEIVKSKKSDDKFLEYYKRMLEEKLTIIIMEYPLRANDVRAFSIYSDIPAVVLNESDKPSIKLFSLFHEICHIVNNNTGICSLEIEQQNQSVETYCNRFAAEFLVPSDDFKSEVSKFSQVDEEAIQQLKKIYGVSKQVIMIRLLEFGYIDKKRYETFKKRIEEKIDQKKFGKRDWDKVFLNRVGNLPLQEVKNAYNKQLITFYDASSILDLKIKYAEKFIA